MLHNFGVFLFAKLFRFIICLNLNFMVFVFNFFFLFIIINFVYFFGGAFERKSLQGFSDNNPASV